MRPKNKATLRTALMALLAAVAFCAFACSGWAFAQEARPIERDIAKAFEAGKLNGLHSVLVLFQGETLAEIYFDGIDERWGTGLGVVSHGHDTLHDMRSITKSVTGLLYGIALSQGKVPGTGANLLAQFPEYSELKGDPLRDRITVGDVLSMRMGTEDVLALAMEHAADRYRYVLSQQMIAAPGEQWSYNDGAPTLIGKLIEDGTGRALEDFARDELFQPLDISLWEWNRTSDGTVSTAAGLRLTARDLAKIGQLVLEGGVFDRRQIVPKSWLDKSFTPSTNPQEIPYGFFWRLADIDRQAATAPIRSPDMKIIGPSAIIVATGRGGQRLLVRTDLGLVVVIFAGNYHDSRDWELPARIIEEYIAPQLPRP